LDAMDLHDLDEVTARDLFGTKRIKREWVPLEELKALDLDGETMGADDMKATFIYGVIVQQIIKEGYIQVRK